MPVKPAQETLELIAEPPDGARSFCKAEAGRNFITVRLSEQWIQNSFELRRFQTTTGEDQNVFVATEIPILAANWSALAKESSIALVALALCGCSLIPDDAKSDFASVSGNQVNVSLPGQVNHSISDLEVGTVAMATGYRLKNGLTWPEVTSFAFAGIAPGHDVGSTVSSGTASYDARYLYVTADYETSILSVSGRPDASSGRIGLTADFGAGTLTGSDAEVTVNGVIRGGGLSGNVVVQYSPYAHPITGPLAGYIGDTGTIAAFHGKDKETALAGGFVGTVN